MTQAPGSVRPFPYPFRAGLAISNDIDNAPFEDFLERHAFLNSTRSTAYGNGLGLEIGDSFWLYTNGSRDAEAFTYFEGTSDRRTAQADTIDTMIESGHLDTLHTWGNFSEQGGFSRPIAERGVKALARHRGRLPVWTNHGDSHNEQMVGRRGWNISSSSSGHADLIHACGIRYMWTGSITSVVGQRQGSRPWLTGGWSYWRDSVVRQTAQALRRAPLGNYFYLNDLMRPLDAENYRFATFIRYGFWDRATRDDLPLLLSADALDRLRDSQGYSVVYVHLFQSRDRHAASASDDALRRLADRAARGEILVTTTGRLLDYYVVANFTSRRVTRDHGRTVIDIDGFRSDAPVTWALTSACLRGLTFYVKDARQAVIRFAGVEIDDLQANPPDESGSESVSVRWIPLRYPLR